MTRAADYITFLTDRYKKEGWEPLVPGPDFPIPNFEPDLFLRKNDDYLVIDVKEAGYKESRAVKVIRNLLEINDKWKFEINIMPSDWHTGAEKIVGEDIGHRIEVAKALADQGHNAEAFILSWTAIEGLLREDLKCLDTNIFSSSALIRKAFEEEKISGEQRQALEAGISVRSRLVHGISQKPTGENVARLLGIATSLAGGSHREPSAGFTGP